MDGGRDRHSDVIKDVLFSLYRIYLHTHTHTRTHTHIYIHISTIFYPIPTLYIGLRKRYLFNQSLILARVCYNVTIGPYPALCLQYRADFNPLLANCGISPGIGHRVTFITCVATNLCWPLLELVGKDTFMFSCRIKSLIHWKYRCIIREKWQSILLIETTTRDHEYIDTPNILPIHECQMNDAYD